MMRLTWDFEGLAVPAKVREVRRTTEYLNVNVEELQWAEPNYHGDVEVRITVPTNKDIVMLRLVGQAHHGHLR
jgi:hypothetical protein